MPDAIINTSPALYLYRIGALDILAQLFERVWIPNAAVLELKEGWQRCATARVCRVSEVLGIGDWSLD